MFILCIMTLAIHQVHVCEVKLPVGLVNQTIYIHDRETNSHFSGHSEEHIFMQ